MKVGQKPELTAAALASAAKQAKTSGPAAEEAAKGAQVATSSAGVSFSNSAKALDSAGRAQTDFNADQVEAMRKKIADGTFSFNAEAIADKLLANTGEILAHSMATRSA
ncbi:flagellar biosynthesis anti-sigma factor FlgM [Comamonas antarctica]|uniref:Negative regulator of flagellin synthesis n=1 Tax=Comamonas antarctica TaxID=2743470 RepID=A0A6N1X6N6_9BURK|nr:flagellar biosynthesis anti-sigma factor FlgM [Comamonas antarctica]QKV54518.1 flagellar biosynthesis anti-sigma factor FlgM [Comamonas antarctica]